MGRIASVLKMERPIPPIMTVSNIGKYHHIVSGYALRYHQSVPFESVPKEAGYAIYTIGGKNYMKFTLYWLLAQDLQVQTIQIYY